jgi:hypothetical protein
MSLEKIHQAIVDGSVGVKTMVDCAARIGSDSFGPGGSNTTRKAREL